VGSGLSLALVDSCLATIGAAVNIFFCFFSFFFFFFPYQAPPPTDEKLKGAAR
jgi:hypothetical protein